jgi:hypothetical protein
MHTKLLYSLNPQLSYLEKFLYDSEKQTFAHKFLVKQTNILSILSITYSVEESEDIIQDVFNVFMTVWDSEKILMNKITLKVTFSKLLKTV